MQLQYDVFANSSPPPPAIPLIRPNPRKLTHLLSELRALEQSGTYSNNGPLVRQFERSLCDRMFGGVGDCATVANATLGLMLAMRHAADAAGRPGGYALMPSFTFAAAAQAAIWAGLTPLLCDIDPATWAACPAAEQSLLARYGREISLLVPYATFGAEIDLDRYERIAQRHGVGVVVDAAASLGTRDAMGRGFATGSRLVSVFSMHATKPFAVAEGGVLYSADPATIATLRRMANFGFGESRSAELPGLNAKMSELAALLALAKLEDIEAISTHRASLAARYREKLQGVGFQPTAAGRRSFAFMPILLPAELAPKRQHIVAQLAAAGIGAGTYFSPHLAEQPYFRAKCRAGSLDATRDIAARILCLPVFDEMIDAEVDHVANCLNEIVAGLLAPVSRPRLQPHVQIAVAS